MSNQVAPDKQMFVCAACGKRSKDRYGEQPIDRGWDESCAIHAVLCQEEKHPDGYFIKVEDKEPAQ